MRHYLLWLSCLLPFCMAGQGDIPLHYYLIAEPEMTLISSTPKIGVEMGATAEQDQYVHRNMEKLELPDDEQKHKFSADSFYVALTEVTFEEYDRFCMLTGYPSPRDEGWGRGSRPVIHVNWYDAVNYCNWLSEQCNLRPYYRVDKRAKDSYGYDVVTIDKLADGYRLPTEGEWEYAARGREAHIFAGSDNLDEVGWYYGNTGKGTKPVAQKKPNKYGIYDLSGNVAEWCWDWYGAYPQANERNYKGPDAGLGRVLRGGAWAYDDPYCRVAARNTNTPCRRSAYFGFRLARTAQQ